MQTWVFSPNKRTNALKKKKTASLPQTIFKNFSARTGYPVTTTTTTTRTMQMKKKKSHQPPQYKSKKKKRGEPESKHTKNTNCICTECSILCISFLSSFAIFNWRGNGWEVEEKANVAGSVITTLEMPRGFFDKSFFVRVCVCKYMCWFQTCTPLKRYIAFLHNSAVPFGVVNEYWFKFFFVFFPSQDASFPSCPAASVVPERCFHCFMYLLPIYVNKVCPLPLNTSTANVFKWGCQNLNSVAPITLVVQAGHSYPCNSLVRSSWCASAKAQPCFHVALAVAASYPVGRASR